MLSFRTTSETRGLVRSAGAGNPSTMDDAICKLRLESVPCLFPAFQGSLSGRLITIASTTLSVRGSCSEDRIHEVLISTSHAQRMSAIPPGTTNLTILFLRILFPRYTGKRI